MDYAFIYTEDQSLETEEDYPYTGLQTDCAFNKAKGKVSASGYTDVPANKPE